MEIKHFWHLVWETFCFVLAMLPYIYTYIYIYIYILSFSFKRTADDFADHFRKKLDNIRDATCNAPAAVIEHRSVPSFSLSGQSPLTKSRESSWNRPTSNAHRTLRRRRSSSDSAVGDLLIMCNLPTFSDRYIHDIVWKLSRESTMKCLRILFLDISQRTVLDQMHDAATPSQFEDRPATSTLVVVCACSKHADYADGRKRCVEDGQWTGLLKCDAGIPFRRPTWNYLNWVTDRPSTNRKRV